MAPLPVELRGLLQRAVLDARVAAEGAAREALGALAVEEDRPFDALDEQQKTLRRGLRAKVRQLGGFDALVAEVAYEQWHRMLFARFLSENNLLIHPDMGVAVSLAECKELAEEAGAANEWVLAAEFAGRMLPGVFRSDDPSLAVRFAHEGRVALEQILTALPPAVFTADDSLGWVYQFWQTEAKKEVNQSERKIGGADLAPVTQLFTEHYMVRFLLENSLGAWWAGRHPDSPLLGEFEYLRRLDDGAPAGGTFEGWPATVAEVTVMDPCCGSGHFLVEAFDMLHKMRMEEEGLDARAAGDAVIRDNLFGLELDPRCTQIAAFAVAFAAWKTGGYRELPQPNIACSGIRIEGQWPEWKKIAAGEERLEQALWQLFELFQHAPDLGSLIDPVRELERDDTLMAVPYSEVRPYLDAAIRNSTVDTDVTMSGLAAAGVADAAAILAGRFSLVATNVPYLQRGKQSKRLTAIADQDFPEGRADLATMMLQRCRRLVTRGGTYALVIPQNFLFLSAYRKLRAIQARQQSIDLLARLGPRAFSSIGGEIVSVVLHIASDDVPSSDHAVQFIEADTGDDAATKARVLREGPVSAIHLRDIIADRDHRMLPGAYSSSELLARFADGYAGVQTGDIARFGRQFWEIPTVDGRRWVRLQSTVDATTDFGGRDQILFWEGGDGEFVSFVKERLGGSTGAWIRGLHCHGRWGVAVSQMGSLPVTLYTGDFFDLNMAVVMPKDDEHLAAIWAYCQSTEYSQAVRAIDHSIKVTNSSLVKVPFELERWKAVAAESYPEGLPDPSSKDATQWLFGGHPKGSTEPLQVAVARLVNYRWPDQEPDELDELADTDGLIALSALAGEPAAADRLRKVLERAYGSEFSPALVDGLLADVGAPGKSLADWLRDGFFDHHLKVFEQRPFVWHIWDGWKDGFSVLANYHTLDQAKLRKLTYSMLGSWIEVQREGAKAGKAGADLRLAAAEDLQRRLGLILDGEAPYDMYVRWKSLAAQPIGWEPDLDDGVRMNIRPFVEAGVLRKTPKIKWGKDRGKNPDGSERINDVHLTLAEKRKARGLPA